MLKKSIILFYLCFLLINLNAKTQDTTPDKSRYYEFSTGFLFTHNLKIHQFYSYKYDYIYDILYPENSSDFQINNMFKQGFSFLFTINFSYYFNQYFGIGITNNIGMELYLSKNIHPMPFFYYQSKISFKIGNYLKKAMIIESGISINSIFPISIELFYNLPIYVGPNLFLGYEVKVNKNFMFTIGGSLEYNFHVYLDHSTSTYIINSILEEIDYTYSYDNIYLNTSLNIGIEFRWKYYYQAKLQR